jgi:hypothetical protein
VPVFCDKSKVNARRPEDALTAPTAVRGKFAVDSPLEGDGFELSVPRVMEVDLARQVPALIAVFELAGTAVTSQRGTKCQRRTV